MSQEKDAAIPSMDGTLEGLRRLSETLVALSSISRSDVMAQCRRRQVGDAVCHPDDDDNVQPNCWTHYRVLPMAVQQSYELLTKGAELVHATSTKYSLMAKIDAAKSVEMANDLLRGCSWVGTACLVLNDALGGSARRHALNAGRNVVRSVLQLLEEQHGLGTPRAADDGNGNDAPPPSSSALAQRTGVVWESCDAILNRLLPLGNRNAMRRDLLGYMKECQETIEEFQAMIDLGPLEDGEGAMLSNGDGDVANDGGESGIDGAAGDNDDENEWEAFLDGQLDRYRPEELAVVLACVALVKCSRGTLNLVLQALDAMGSRLEEASASSSSSSSETPDRTASDAVHDNNNNEGDPSRSLPPQLSDSDKERLARMGRLHERACHVGVGMTDLGATLYPPLDLDAVGVQVLRQAHAIQQVLRSMVSEHENDDDNDDKVEVPTALEEGHSGVADAEWPLPVVELHQKLTLAVIRRQAEALEALVEAQEGVAAPRDAGEDPDAAAAAAAASAAASGEE